MTDFRLDQNAKSEIGAKYSIGNFVKDSDSLQINTSFGDSSYENPCTICTTGFDHSFLAGYTIPSLVFISGILTSIYTDGTSSPVTIGHSGLSDYITPDAVTVGDTVTVTFTDGNTGSFTLASVDSSGISVFSVTASGINHDPGIGSGPTFYNLCPVVADCETVTTLTETSGVLTFTNEDGISNDITVTTCSGFYVTTGTSLSGVTSGPFFVNCNSTLHLWSSGVLFAAASGSALVNMELGSINAHTDINIPGTATSGQILEYDGATWQAVNNVGTPFVCSDLAACSISGLSDVNTTTAISGQTLIFNGTIWLPASGSFTFACANLNTCSANDLGDITITAAAHNEVLVFNSGTSIWEDRALTHDDLGDFSTPTITEISGIHTVEFTDGATDTIDICNSLQFCTITSLGNVQVAAAVSGQRLTFDGINWIPETVSSSIFACSDLALCSISGLSDVDTTAAVSGNVLEYNGIEWITGSKSTFACADLNACSVDALSDVTITAAAHREILVYNSGTSQWEDGTYAHSDLSDFTASTITEISGIHTVGFTNGTTDTIDICNSLQFCTITSLGNVAAAAAISGQILTFNGINWIPGADSTFGCANLNTCSVDSLSDITITAAAHNETLVYNSGTLQWEDRLLTHDDLGDFVIPTITEISGVHTVTFTDGGTGSIDICASLSSCSLSSLSGVDVSSASSGQILTYNGVDWLPGTDISNHYANADLTADADHTHIWDVNTLTETYTAGPVTHTFSKSGTLFSDLFSGPGGSSRLSNQATVSSVNFSGANGSSEFNANVNGLELIFGPTADLEINGAPGTSGQVFTSYGDGIAPSWTTFDTTFSCTDLASCSISGLSDVNTTAATSGNLLRYNGSTWVDATISHSELSDYSIPSVSTSVGISTVTFTDGTTGTVDTCANLGSCDLSALSGVDTSTAVSGDLLLFDGVNWLPTIYENYSNTDFTINTDRIHTWNLTNSLTETFLNGPSTLAVFKDNTQFDVTIETAAALYNLDIGSLHGGLELEASGIAGHCIFDVHPGWVGLDIRNGGDFQINEDPGVSGQFFTSNGNNTTPAWSTSTLANLGDTNVSAATSGQVLTYNGINWIPGADTNTNYANTDLTADGSHTHNWGTNSLTETYDIGPVDHIFEKSNAIFSSTFISPGGRSTVSNKTGVASVMFSGINGISEFNANLQGLEINIGGTTDLEINGDPGVSGQVFTSNGNGVAPTWTTPDLNKQLTLLVVDFNTVLLSGNEQLHWRVPSDLDGLNLINASAQLGAAQSTAGTPTIEITRLRFATPGGARTEVSMLSTPITIDANEWDSKDATTPPVIDTSNDDVAEGDLVRVDVTDSGTGAQGLFVSLGFGS